MDKKLRLSVYLDPDVMHSLADYAERRNQPRSMIAEAAIASFLSPDADERREAATVKRLDRIDRRMQRFERDLGVSIEAMAVFVHFWLALTPQMPDPAQAATKSKSRERYATFLDAVGRRIANGSNLLQEISEDVSSILTSD